MTALPVYLDNHATTRVDPRVVDAMLPYFTERYGNAGSSSHAFGWDAKDAVDKARAIIASSIGAAEREIVFTSGATESNNLAIRGIAERRRRRGDHLVSVTTEHRALLDPLAKLGRRGFDVTLLDVESAGSSRAGWLDPQQVAEVIRDDTCLVSVMLANNEVGVIQSIGEIAQICRAKGVPFHCDATQAVGKIPVDVEALGVDLMSFTAHKLHGPKGIGALYVRRRSPGVRLEPQIDGGGQEFGFRSGTLNVPGIVGFAVALELALAELPTSEPRIRMLRDHLWNGLSAGLEAIQLNGPALLPVQWRLAMNLNVSFTRVDGEALLLAMKEVAVSSGSACTSANPEPSHVLLALGLNQDLTRASLRYGLSRFTTAAEVEFAIGATIKAVERLRRLASPA